MESQGDIYTESSHNEIDDTFGTSMTIDCDPNIARRERTVMAICTASSRCGCAVHYDSTIHLVADRQDPGDPYKGLDIIIQRIDPDVVIVSMAQKQLITFIEKRFQFKLIDVSSSHRNIEDVSDPAFTLAIVPNSWFKISHGEQKLIDSQWIKSKGIIDPQERSLTVFTKVKKSVDVCAIRAISAIDKYLTYEFAADITSEGQYVTAAFESNIEHDVEVRPSQVSQVTRTTTEEIKIPDDLMPIIDVRYIDPGPVLSIDKFTLRSLGVFQDLDKKRRQPIGEPNPDGLVPSLYEILDQCQSIQGKRTMRTIMMWPLQSLEEIQHRYEVVDFFLRAENRLLRDQLNLQLKNIVPLTGILLKLSQSVGGFKEFSILYKSMSAFLSIAELLRAQGSEIEILKRILNMDTPQFRNAIDQIVNTIDFEASKRSNHIEVCQGVSEDVESKRLVVNDLTKFCQEVEIKETARYKDVLGKPCRVSYIPRIGFLESINFTSMSEVDKIRMNKEFAYMLSTEESVYFKTKMMDELDKRVGDVTCDLIDLQEAVVVEMQNKVLEQSECILKFAELCGELDCFVAFSTVSLQRGFVMPELDPSSDEIDVRNAFHPAQSSCHTVIPNDIRFTKENNEKAARVMIITGPNSCGKTTYMKTACLVVYMAHIGCFVPASYARIPLVDAILTRLQSANSISTCISTFATDLNQINYALSRATPRSILAIDEFGKGTQVRDGFHLLKGLIIYFVARGPNSPHVMVATHFNRLADYLQSYNEYILYKTFKVKRDMSKETIVYEFKIVDGVSESSLADQVAINAGIPSTIIQRASQIRDYITGGRAIQQRPPCGA
uniref:MutS 5 n=1 Tax=Aceria tosichella TaxID=561515 RepID=A0A6G1SMZ2_9ACAR